MGSAALPQLALQISPEARAAYFDDYLEVAEKECRSLLGEVSTRHHRVGPLEFLLLENTGLDRQQLLRLSFVQGLYAVEGETLRPLPEEPRFLLHRDFVFASKYRGKTNERLTQLLLNLGLAQLELPEKRPLKLLDPMCGRGTTLYWALRYGIRARGIEQDPGAIAEIRQHLRRCCKLHRQKHQLQEGHLGRAKRKDSRRLLEFSTPDGELRVLTGDARETPQLLGGERVDLIVSDLPYGVQHFTTDGTRNPLAVLEQCAAGWRQTLKAEGAMVLAFNRYQPKRAALLQLLSDAGFAAQPFSAAHRMSESIVRDIVVLRTA